MRLTLVLPSLEAGGAERVMSVLANRWVARGRCVTLLTLAAPGSDFYPVDERVRRVGLGVWREPGAGGGRRLLLPLARRRALRAAIREAAGDVVISFMLKMNVLTLEAARGMGVKVIVSERVDPAYPFGPLWTGLRRLYYPRADALVVQTRAVAAALGRLNRRVRVIPNPVEPVVAPVAPDERADPPIALAVGRLHPQKGFDLLLGAFARVAAAHPAWTLEVCGEGPARDELDALARELGIDARVRFAGRTQRIGERYRAASLFVLSSRQEGFPNVLVEAMAAGLPVVAFDCPSGPAEIVRHDEDGLLVPAGDVPALAAALDRLMSSAGERARLGGAAPAVAERFCADAVTDLWDATIADLREGGA